MNAPCGINTHIKHTEDMGQGLPKLRPTPDTVQGISWQLGPGSMPCLVLSGTQVSSPKSLLLGSIFLPNQLQAVEGYAEHGSPHTQKVVPKDYKGAGKILLLSLHSRPNTELCIGHMTVVFCCSPR